jgi:predicted chitinase
VAFLRFYSTDVIAVEFSLGDGFELTGRGDEIAIFATVKQAIAEYLKRYGRPRFLLFTSKGAKRTRTYSTLIRRYAAGMGYKTTTAHALPEIVQKNLGDFMQHDDYFVLQDTHAELDEGWRENTAAAMAAATLGYGALTQQPATTASVPIAQAQQQTQTAPQSQDPIFQDQNPQRDYLVAQARAAGIRGAELSHFVAQAAHETGDWQHMVEQPPQGARNPQRYFTKKYEGKRILGNVRKGDGYRYRGRGYIQLTGRDNYTRVGRALGLDLVNHPELAADPATAARIAVYFWQKRVAPRVGDFERAGVRDVTHSINPGQRGLERRQAQFAKVSQR